MVAKIHRNHIVGRVCGVTAEDTKVQAAEKAIKVMRDAGFPNKDVLKAQRMLDDYKRRTGVT